MDIYSIALYVGIAAFILLVFSFLSGMRIIKFNPKWRLHKKIGVVGFVLLCFHACVMLYTNFFG